MSPVTATELLGAVSPWVWAVANRIASRRRRWRVEAEDLYQEAMLAIAAIADGYNPELSRPLTYIRRRAVGAMIDYIRDRSGYFRQRSAMLRGVKTPVVVAASAGLGSYQDGWAPLEGLSATFDPEVTDTPAEEFRASLRGLGVSLDTTDLECARLRYCEDLTLSEIGRRVGLSESRISQRMSRIHEETMRAIHARGLTLQNAFN